MAEVTDKDKQTEYLLEVRHLKKYFPVRSGILKRIAGFVKAVDDVSFFIRKGKILGLVGESGCGKSTLGKVILGLLEPTEGKVLFQGVQIYDLDPRAMRQLRRSMQIIFQDPQASLNPRMTIHDIIARPMKIFGMVRIGRDGPKALDEILASRMGPQGRELLGKICGIFLDEGCEDHQCGLGWMPPER